MENKEFMIIDGSSLLYRGFYALPLLNNKEGIYTNGIYGFLNMLYKVIDDRDPDNLVVVFDKSGPTFRHKEYSEYKGTRKSTPSELAQQFPIIREILDAMNIKYLELDGFEADDIAGTLAKTGEENGYNTTLVTGDRDYLQLATDKTQVIITKKGITEFGQYNRAEIVEKYGITPEQLIDLKGFMGDASDNIPGVPGVGEKTGIKLIKEYGTMENVYENLDKIKAKKLNENLRENEDLAYLSRKLGTIIRDVPLENTIDDFKLVEPNIEELRKLYERLEFTSLLNRIGGEEAEEVVLEHDYILLKDLDKIEELKTKIKDEKTFIFKFIVDEDRYVENNPILMGIKLKNEELAYLIYIDDDFKIEEFREIFEDKTIEKIGHGLKGDIVSLFKNNIQIENIHFDTIIGQYLIDPSQNTYSLNDLSKEYLNYYGLDEEALLGKGKSKKKYSEIEGEDLENYLSFGLHTISNIIDEMIKIIDEQDMKELYYSIELPLVEVLGNMEYLGFKLDTNELHKLGDEYELEINSLRDEIHILAGREFNVNSPKQLGEILFDELGLPVIKKTKTGYSTNAEVLEKLEDQHPIIKKVLRYRQIVKLKSTYIDGLLELINNDTNRVHSTFNQTITTTGRISSTEPNLQNIPIRTEDGRKIRKAFISDGKDFTLVDADYSQIELRVLAHITEDPHLVEAFLEEEDIHRKTASQVFGVSMDEVDDDLRSRAKAVNFGIVYGISDYGLSRDLNIPRYEAKEYIDNYLKNYIKVREYMDHIVEKGKEDGYVETILNRRRYIPELQAKNFNIRSFGERIALNTPIQGSAADIIKMAMVEVYREIKRRKLKSRLILQVHDELIIETHIDELDEVKEMLKDIMENAIELKVPLTVDLEVGDSWYDAK